MRTCVALLALIAALAFGGVPLMVQTVESLLGQRLDHVVFMDFEGFKGLTDAVGGVTIDVKVPFTAGQTSDIHFNAGPQTMNGDQALAFVRERYAFADGDYQRVRDLRFKLPNRLASRRTKPCRSGGTQVCSPALVLAWWLCF